MKEFMDSYTDESYLLVKDYLSDYLGNLSQKLFFFQGSLVFYQRYLEGSIYYNNEQNEKNRENIRAKDLEEIQNYTKMQKNYLNI